MEGRICECIVRVTTWVCQDLPGWLTLERNFDETSLEFELKIAALVTSATRPADKKLRKIRSLLLGKRDIPRTAKIWKPGRGQKRVILASLLSLQKFLSNFMGATNRIPFQKIRAS